jgi:hypothetical protein
MKDGKLGELRGYIKIIYNNKHNSINVIPPLAGSVNLVPVLPNKTGC